MLLEKIISEGNIALTNRKFVSYFDRPTYISQRVYLDFLEDKDLKKVWCIKLAKRYKVNWKDLYDKTPDYCPWLMTPFDFGLGLNMVFRIAKGRHINDYYKPQVDHIRSKDLYPELKYDIDNLQIISARANRIKSNIQDPNELIRVAEGMRNAK